MSAPSPSSPPSPSAPGGDLTFVVRTIARTAVDNERAFSDLDAVAGDGDFGYSLARGFEIVLADWDDLAADAPADFLKKVAMVISKRVGGTSGPLWGTAFLRAAGAVKDRPELDAGDAVGMLRAAAEGIKARGRSDVGDKTLLDALIPMTDALERRLAPGEPA
ncbi:DAK2 domain-containing protein, partial [Streptomyces sp. NPDC048279]|uniref:DAK2 domain-containing protein n=1 Tax=Streptomyces sp. NPDC048279 TaxID=3154714 RepID=UPI0034435A53